MRGTDCTNEQIAHAREFWISRVRNRARLDDAGCVYVSLDDIARMMAWYGALRFIGARDGIGGTLEQPGELVTIHPDQEAS